MPCNQISASLSARLCGPGSAALRGNIFPTSVGTRRKFPSTYTGDQFKQGSLQEGWQVVALGVITQQHTRFQSSGGTQDTDNVTVVSHREAKDKASAWLIAPPAATAVFLPRCRHAANSRVTLWQRSGVLIPEKKGKGACWERKRRLLDSILGNKHMKCQPVLTR